MLVLVTLVVCICNSVFPILFVLDLLVLLGICLFTDDGGLARFWVVWFDFLCSDFALSCLACCIMLCCV